MSDKPIVKKITGLSPVWIVPITALLIAVWLAVQAQMEKGVTVEIVFAKANDIIVGQTLVKLKDVEVGVVRKVRLSPDLKNVIVTAEIDRTVVKYLSVNTRFWVVTPKVSATGVSNLGTLISGVYIVMDPGEQGTSASHFRGLDEPPILQSDEPGTTYILESEALGSIDVGSPVYFRQIRVGEVVGYNLADDRNHVNLQVFVRAPHDQYIRTRTRFWNVSGFGVTIGAEGMKAQMASLASLINGGIAFDNAAGFTSDKLADEGHRFYLHPDRESVLEGRFTIKYFYVLKFSGSVRGLTVGAPVEFRGIKIGEVVDVRLVDTNNVADGIEVYITMEPQRLDSTTSPSREDVNKRLQSMVEQGLRGVMRTASVITGSKYIDMAFVSDAEPQAFKVLDDTISQIPTVNDATDQMVAQVGDILNKVNKIPFDQIGRDLSQSMASLNKMLSTLDQQNTAGKMDSAVSHLDTTLQSANEALRQMATTLESTNAMLSPDSEYKYEMTEMLKAISDAAQSVDIFLDELNRHPNALISGSKKDQ